LKAKQIRHIAKFPLIIGRFFHNMYTIIIQSLTFGTVLQPQFCGESFTSQHKKEGNILFSSAVSVNTGYPALGSYQCAYCRKQKNSAPLTKGRCFPSDFYYNVKANRNRALSFSFYRARRNAPLMAKRFGKTSRRVFS